MDEDVKLSMQQAHEKWVIKAKIMGCMLLLGALTFWIHDCNASDRQKTCSDVIIDPRVPAGGVIRCPDDRQKLESPPGWTWIRCSCPGPRPFER